MAQLIDSQTCEGVGWNPRLYVGQRANGQTKFDYFVWSAVVSGETRLIKKTGNRRVALAYFRSNPGAVLRMQHAASDRVVGMAINDGSGLCALPEECFI
ncbi:MAG TPA: hypothetical protein PLQ71_02835 [Nitrospira sp.]|nr:hypothetical protein [Nitrospira sp.]